LNITLDQARALVAVAQRGTVQKAAQSLSKGHSAVLYLLKSLEEQIQLPLFDRSGYRNQLTAEGELVLKHCRSLLETSEQLERLVHRMRTGWEAQLKIVYDGVIDFRLLAEAVLKLQRLKAPTETQMFAAFLQDVEQRFLEERADLMVTILPIRQLNVEYIELPSIEMLLVAHSQHPLVSKGRKKVNLKDLHEHTYIKIKTQENPLGLSTDQMSLPSHFSVNDFFTKKMAIQKKLGFGWLPEYLIQRELKNKELTLLSTDFENRHRLTPKLYFRNYEEQGLAAKKIIEILQATRDLK
jgi:DNA-binding transcriptional LysR family regulator